MVEKAGVIMTEAAFKMLLEALTGKGINSPFEGSELPQNKEVDSLVSEYKEYTKNTEKQEKNEVESDPEKSDKVAELVAKFLYDVEYRTIDEIRDFLETCGYNYPGRAMGPIMRAVLKRNVLIERYGLNKYCILDPMIEAEGFENE